MATDWAVDIREKCALTPVSSTNIKSLARAAVSAEGVISAKPSLELTAPLCATPLFFSV